MDDNQVIPYVRPLEPKMGLAVARRTVFRAEDQENWGKVAERVALGNTSLVEGAFEEDYLAMRNAIAKQTLLMSGRHLQHGDANQKNRPAEIYTNCSTSSCSFLLFTLLLNGSGVGRDYSQNVCLVDWSAAPQLINVCEPTHPDFDASVFKTPAEAADLCKEFSAVTTVPVQDSREGWGQAMEVYEVMAFERRTNEALVLDWSLVRPAGQPIKGMQNRPASGPVATARAFQSIANLRHGTLPLWKQAMFVDHYLAECVVVGGARRSARMSTKSWLDEDVIDFINIKKEHGLWSSNNSVITTKEFYQQIKIKDSWAQKVFKAVTEASYFDGTGEPGLINVENFAAQPAIDWTLFEDGNFAHSGLYQVNSASKPYMQALVQAVKAHEYHFIVNPCVTADTWIQTDSGPRQVCELIGQSFNALVGNKSYKATGFFQTGVKPVFKINTRRGYSLRLTDNHKVLVEVSRKVTFSGDFNVKHAWVEVKDLKPGDKIVVDNHRGTDWNGPGGFEEGWILGQIVGDGGYNTETKYNAYVRFWGSSQKYMQQTALDYVNTLNMPRRSDATGSTNLMNKTSQVSLAAFDTLASKYLTPTGKQLLPDLEKTSFKFYQGFLRGLFDADGTVLFNAEKGRSVRLAQADLSRLETVQRMLSRMGIASTIYKNRKPSGMHSLPDGKGSLKMYFTKSNHELLISKDNIIAYSDLIGFNEPAKAEKLKKCVETLNIKRNVYRDQFTTQVTEIMPDGIEAVYDCTVNEVHRFDANGLVVHNCGEIALNMLGGYCVIADVVPYFADTLEEAEEAFRIATRALIRVNASMDSIYRKEVLRTNRIGVGFTGIHEFAWKFFGLGFEDILDEHGKAQYFWQAMARFARAVKEEAQLYAHKLGMPAPHTNTTVKPAGSTSKLAGITEGAHLPAMREYMRWVQFRTDDPLVAQYKLKGYPTKKLQSYEGTTVVGFPTQPLICKLGLGDKLKTASEATLAEQYRWLMLIEKYWLRSVDESGQPLAQDTGNQTSITIKYDPKLVSYKDFVQAMLHYQSQVRAASVMPVADMSAYEYQPEEPITNMQDFLDIVAQIQDENIVEDIDLEHLKCQNGACPI